MTDQAKRSTTELSASVSTSRAERRGLVGAARTLAAGTVSRHRGPDPFAVHASRSPHARATDIHVDTPIRGSYHPSTTAAREYEGTIMRRLCAAGVAIVVWLMVGGAFATAQSSPDPSTTGQAGVSREEAVALVLASDERFLGVEDFDHLRRLAAREMSLQPLLGSSYYRVLPTMTTEEPYEDIIVWRYPGDWLIEVTLVEDCTDPLDETGPVPDPCGWRHSWFYRVQSDGTVSLLFDEGDLSTDAASAQ